MKKTKIVVLTGAGVSAESGVSTFRDSNGLWENYKVEDVASIEGWYRDPALVLEFYNARRAQLAEVKPNAAHIAIASLEQDYDVTVVTQNVDNLHERAGSTRIIHLHGELTKVRPENCCNDRDGYSEETVFDIGNEPVQIGDLAPNGAQLRPHIVWFGEAVPKIEAAIDAVEAADIILIVGTCLQVYPAAGLYRYAKMDAPIYIIDPNGVSVCDSRITYIKDVATSGMETFKKLERMTDLVPLEMSDKVPFRTGHRKRLLPGRLLHLVLAAGVQPGGNGFPHPGGVVHFRGGADHPPTPRGRRLHHASL